jgi:hypothetical protein
MIHPFPLPVRHIGTRQRTGDSYIAIVHTDWNGDVVLADWHLAAHRLTLVDRAVLGEPAVVFGSST